MEKKKTWELMREISDQLMLRYIPAMEKKANDLGLKTNEFFVAIIIAHLFEPDPISAERLRIRNPYSSLEHFKNLLSSTFSSGFLDVAEEGGYLLNSKGYLAFSKIVKTAYRKLERITLLPLDQIEELKFLLSKLVQASILSSEPSSKWCILHSRRLDPGRQAAALITIDQYLSDLAAFRDDAHLASWADYTNSGHAWEILGLVWQGLVSSIDEVIVKTKRRAWSGLETYKAIEILKSKGWVEEKETLMLSEEGRRIREEAENKTDQIFFSPWNQITTKEYIRMNQLLNLLKKSFTEK